MKKKLFIFLLCAVFAVPAFAVFNEKDIARTISVLCQELNLTWMAKNEQDLRHEKTSQMAELQHRETLNTVRWINELTLILYSQEKDFTLDQTYAMEGVMDAYKNFNRRRKPQFSNIGTIDNEIERYQRLIEALRLLPPRLDVIEDVPDTLRYVEDSVGHKNGNISLLLDSLVSSFNEAPMIVREPETVTQSSGGKKNLLKDLAFYGIDSKREAADTTDADSFILPLQAQNDRDSCIVYAKAIINSYMRQKERIEEEECYFAEVNSRLLQNYEYSKSRYEEIQKYIFVTGQSNYFYVLANFGKYVHDMFDDMEQKYGSGFEKGSMDELQESQWRGFGLSGILLYSLWHILIISLAVVLLFRVILKKVRPFDTEAFRKVRPVAVLLAISVIYSILITVSLFFPMSNSMNVAAFIVLIYLWFVIALLLSLLVSLKPEHVRSGLLAFLPVLIVGLLTMICRIFFLPDKVIHLMVTPILVAFLLWQIVSMRKFKSRCQGYRLINTMLYITAVVFGLSLLSSIEGYSLFALMLTMWWIFQMSAVTTLTSFAYLMRFFEKKWMGKRKEQYESTHKMVSRDEDGDYIRVTWFYDFIYKVVIPVAGVFSFLGCLWLAFGVFNLTETCRTVINEPFLDFTNADGSSLLQVSLIKLAAVAAYFFLFRYLNYLVRSLYRVNRFENVMKKSDNYCVHKNDVNLTLAYNVIGIIVWGLFVLYSVDALKIPVGALSIVAAGLATGIGLALKDVLNNFIYGIQLMSGRLRVGDILECDGLRGTVEKISYQSTEITTTNGAVISFTNSTLFNKNFQNLTKNTPYEYVSIVVSVSYGEDIAKVRHLISDALKDYSRKKDKYGRYLTERKAVPSINIDQFGDSGVNISIGQMVLVESKYVYLAEIKELVYKLFNDNGISMPFPQQEVSIINFPKQ